MELKRRVKKGKKILMKMDIIINCNIFYLLVDVLFASLNIRIVILLRYCFVRIDIIRNVWINGWKGVSSVPIAILRLFCE